MPAVKDLAHELAATLSPLVPARPEDLCRDIGAHLTSLNVAAVELAEYGINVLFGDDGWLIEPGTSWRLAQRIGHEYWAKRQADGAAEVRAGEMPR